MSGGTTLGDLVKAMNGRGRVAAGPDHGFQAIKASGALQADLEIF